MLHVWYRNCFPFRSTYVHSVRVVRLLTLPELIRSSAVFRVIRVARSSVFCVVFCRSLLVIVLFAIVLYDLLRFTASGFLFGVFNRSSTVLRYDCL